MKNSPRPTISQSMQDFWPKFFCCLSIKMSYLNFLFVSPFYFYTSISFDISKFLFLNCLSLLHTSLSCYFFPPSFILCLLLSLSLSLSLPVFLFLSLCLSLLTLNSRFFFSTSSSDSSTILPSCLGIRAFLEIAKLALYFPASSAPTWLPRPLPFLILLLPPRPRPATSTIKQPETLCRYLAQTNADTLSFSRPKDSSDKSSTGVTNTENKNFTENEKTVIAFVFLNQSFKRVTHCEERIREYNVLSTHEESVSRQIGLNYNFTWNPDF